MRSATKSPSRTSSTKLARTVGGARGRPVAARRKVRRATAPPAKKRGLTVNKDPGKGLSLQALFARKKLSFEYPASERVFLRARSKGR